MYYFSLRLKNTKETFYYLFMNFAVYEWHYSKMNKKQFKDLLFYKNYKTSFYESL